MILTFLGKCVLYQVWILNTYNINNIRCMILSNGAYTVNILQILWIWINVQSSAYIEKSGENVYDIKCAKYTKYT